MGPKWCIYYADGSRFSHEDGSWEDAPVDGVQLVAAQYPGEKRVLFHGHDFYPAIQGEPYGTDDLGPFLRQYVKQVKHGLCLTREQWRECYRACMDDPMWGET